MSVNYPASRKAVVLDRLQHLENVVLDVPPLHKNEVLLRVRSVGICGSDVNYYMNGGSTIAPVKYPHILGHEAAGDVLFVGDNVSDIHVGDRVALEPGYPCGKCSYCREGKYNLCEHISFMATPIYVPYSEGAFVEYSLRPSFGFHKIPDSLSYNEAAMMEPLAVALQAVEAGDAIMGMAALILGCGPIAMCVLLSLRAAGVTNIYMIDIVAERTAFATELGATAVSQSLNSEFLQQIYDETNGRGLDLVFDTTDYAPLVNQSIPAIRKGGKIVLIAVPHHDAISLDIVTLFKRQIGVSTTFRYANQYPKAIRLVANGQIPIHRIITHSFGFDKADEAFQLAASRSGNVCKIVLNW